MPPTLTQKQSDAWHLILNAPDKRRILFDGGGRSTKTFLICAWLIGQCGTIPGIRILIVRKYRNAAEKSLFRDTLPKLLQGNRAFKVNESDMVIRHRGGGELWIDGLDNNERVQNVLGREYAHIFYNEATQAEWSTIQLLASRLSQNVPGLDTRKLILDCNPKNQRHWLYKAGVMHVDPDTGAPLSDAAVWARMHWTPYDNPHLPPDALATYEAMTGVMRRRMLDGEWCEQDGAVYPEFEELPIDQGGHVFGNMPDGCADWTRFRVVDFGYINPFVCLWAMQDGDGRLWLYRERYVSGQTCRVHAAEIHRAEPMSCVTIADHDAEDRATLAEEGISTVAARKAVGAGIQAVKERLVSRRLFIHESLRETIGEFMDYSWAPAQEGRQAKEEPLKEHDHCLVAGTLIECSHGHVAIERVIAGDHVMTRQGWKKVVKAWKTGSQVKTMRLISSNGYMIEGTPEHKVWTENRGFIQLRELTQCDTLLTWQTTSQLNIAASSTDAIRTQSSEHVGSISRQEDITERKASSIFIKRFGFMKSVLFQTDITSTIRTAIHSITNWRIWNVFRLASISQTTCTTEPMSRRKRQGSILKRFDHSRRHGTPAKRVENGIVNTGKRSSENSRLRVNASAINAEKHSCLAAFSRNGSVVPTASKNGAGCLGLITCSECVYGAENHGLSTNTRFRNFVPVTVESVSDGKSLRDVYDLEVEDAHEFIANGILVHNSMDAIRYLVMHFDHANKIHPSVGTVSPAHTVKHVVDDAANKMLESLDPKERAEAIAWLQTQKRKS